MPTPAPSVARDRPARDRLLAAAAELFYADGIAATGIDAITRAAGVARMSLYNNFSSKDDLVFTYLEARHAEWLGLYQARLAVAADPAARVLAVVDAYLDHAAAASREGFRGCGLLNAAAELPADSPGRAVVARHKAEVRALLVEHLTAAGTSDVDSLAGHIALLLEGGMALAGLTRDREPLDHARQITVELVAAQARRG